MVIQGKEDSFQNTRMKMEAFNHQQQQSTTKMLQTVGTGAYCGEQRTRFRGRPSRAPTKPKPQPLAQRILNKNFVKALRGDSALMKPINLKGPKSEPARKPSSSVESSTSKLSNLAALKCTFVPEKVLQKEDGAPLERPKVKRKRLSLEDRVSDREEVKRPCQQKNAEVQSEDSRTPDTSRVKPESPLDQNFHSQPNKLKIKKNSSIQQVSKMKDKSTTPPPGRMETATGEEVSFSSVPSRLDAVVGRQCGPLKPLDSECTPLGDSKTTAMNVESIHNRPGKPPNLSGETSKETAVAPISTVSLRSSLSELNSRQSLGYRSECRSQFGKTRKGARTAENGAVSPELTHLNETSSSHTIPPREESSVLRLNTINGELNKSFTHQFECKSMSENCGREAPFVENGVVSPESSNFNGIDSRWDISTKETPELTMRNSNSKLNNSRKPPHYQSECQLFFGNRSLFPKPIRIASHQEKEYFKEYFNALYKEYLYLLPRLQEIHNYLEHLHTTLNVFYPESPEFLRAKSTLYKAYKYYEKDAVYRRDLGRFKNLSDHLAHVKQQIMDHRQASSQKA